MLILNPEVGSLSVGRAHPHYFSSKRYKFQKALMWQQASRQPLLVVRWIVCEACWRLLALLEGSQLLSSISPASLSGDSCKVIGTEKGWLKPLWRRADRRALSPSQLKVSLRFFSPFLFNYSLPETHDRAFISTIATLSFSLRPSALP